MEKYATPHDVGDPTLAFPASVIGTLLPRWADIPEEFHKETVVSAPWYRFQQVWFAYGLDEDSGFVGVDLKEGIDGNMAFRHLATIQGSYEPKHEHKIAGVAWLASLWFNEVVWEKKAENPS